MSFRIPKNKNALSNDMYKQINNLDWFTKSPEVDIYSGILKTTKELTVKEFSVTNFVF